MKKMIFAAALAAATVSAPAIGQVGNSQGLVNVAVQDVTLLNNFLNDTQIAALNNLSVPVTVQAPISVAANVCDLSVAALAAQRKAGDATCTAKSGSKALADVVTRQKLKQKK